MDNVKRNEEYVVVLILNSLDFLPCYIHSFIPMAEHHAVVTHTQRGGRPLPGGVEKSDIDNQLKRILNEVKDENLHW